MVSTSLDQPEIKNVLNHLHGESGKDFWQYSKFAPMIIKDLMSGKKNLHPNSLVIADDVVRFKKSLRDYCDFMSDPSNGFISVILPIGDGMQYSIKA